jgi:hypothetical protein
MGLIAFLDLISLGATGGGVALNFCLARLAGELGEYFARERFA